MASSLIVNGSSLQVNPHFGYLYAKATINDTKSEGNFNNRKSDISLGLFLHNFIILVYCLQLCVILTFPIQILVILYITSVPEKLTASSRAHP